MCMYTNTYEHMYIYMCTNIYIIHIYIYTYIYIYYTHASTFVFVCLYVLLSFILSRMLDMGFEPQIRKIVGQIRPDRQTLM